MYAGRKRRKPVQRAVKQPPVEGVKSNPSKRHRDRLNSELDRLASLLPFPEEVTSSLDKLSILRLSVSYLRAKNFFSVALKNHNCKGLTGNSSSHDNNKPTGLTDRWIPEGELLLQALNGFVLVTTAEGIIFYSSHTIQDYLGFHQTDVMHQSVFELIHTEDQQEFRRNLHWALNPPDTAPPDHSPPDGEPVSNMSLVTYNPDQLPPENSSFLERSFVCRFRCLLDNSSGFLALNLQGRLKFLHGQNRRLDDGCQVPPQLALFAIATPLQPPSIMEIRTKNMIFRTKHKLDFTPMACDAKGKIVLGYTEAELRVRGSGYQFIHAADMLYCAENHVRMIKTGESGLTVFRLLTKENRWKWVQANARLVYKNGKPDYIIATQRPLVDEEGGEHLRKRSMHLPFTFATGEALLYQTSYPIPGFPDNAHGKGKNSKAKKAKADGSKSSKDEVDPSSLLGALMRQDESVYVCQPAVEPKMGHHHHHHRSFFADQEEPGSGGGGGGFGSMAVPGDGWGAAVPNGFPFGGGSKSEPSSFDPLLATLDSLSLESEETCSNSELFSALENLGLNAEDLELLLLDERMIRVEMEPDYIPSLNDLLTNNEILSYIHDSLESGARADAADVVVASGNSSSSGSSISSGSQMDVVPSAETPNLTLLPATATATFTQSSYTPIPEPCPVPMPTPTPPGTTLPPTYPQYRPHRPPAPPIVQLSQQMHQHLSGQAGAPVTWVQGSPSDIPPMPRVPFTPHMNSAVSAVHNGHWVPQPEPVAAGLDDRCRLQQPALGVQLTPSTTTTTMTTGIHPNSRAQEAWQQRHLLAQLQQAHVQHHFKPPRLEDGTTAPSSSSSSSSSSVNGLYPTPEPQWQAYNCASQVELVSDGPCFPNGHTSHAQNARAGVAHMDYSMAEDTDMDYPLNSRVPAGGPVIPSAYPSGLQKAELQHQTPLQQPKAPLTPHPHPCYPQHQANHASLEQLLGLGQNRNQHPPHLGAYGMIDQHARCPPGHHAMLQAL
ncbi:aryl hydrocarbon receptor-like [Alosa pseudoharengus]|uniref:aryl hydrocarbon receptor-like n=1 Tax=Alosa pseudoharengus TaxID=34774 RepID=UPI003F8A6923